MIPLDPETQGLRKVQISVLQILAKANGPLTKQKIALRRGEKTPQYTSRAIGRSDPEARASFEQTKDGGGSPGHPCPSLLTLGYVQEHELDIDGLRELTYEITPAGRAVLKAVSEPSLQV